MASTNQDPSPAEIAQRAAEIRATWSPQEHFRRLRADLRPQVLTADGRLEPVTASNYDGHLANYEALQEAVV